VLIKQRTSLNHAGTRSRPPRHPLSCRSINLPLRLRGFLLCIATTDPSYQASHRPAGASWSCGAKSPYDTLSDPYSFTTYSYASLPHSMDAVGEASRGCKLPKPKLSYPALEHISYPEATLLCRGSNYLFWSIRGGQSTLVPRDFLAILGCATSLLGGGRRLAPPHCEANSARVGILWLVEAPRVGGRYRGPTMSPTHLNTHHNSIYSLYNDVTDHYVLSSRVMMDDSRTVNVPVPADKITVESSVRNQSQFCENV
jgi:hypothetical protein